MRAQSHNRTTVSVTPTTSARGSMPDANCLPMALVRTPVHLDASRFKFSHRLRRDLSNTPDQRWEET